MAGARNFREYPVWKEAVDFFAHFLDFALGSAFEVETQLTIAKNVGYMDKVHYDELRDKLQSIERQLNGLKTSIRKSQRQG
jgi:four helix bundle protein